MGVSIESLQNAYRGFSRGNFTMLDNLALGYAGTKEEMQRLLKDAEKLSGVKYDLSSYADIVEAIHVVQEEMGITGTTAREAASTIQGSVSSMGSAWENLVTGIADENADVSGLIDDFVESAATAADNIIPRITQILSGMGSAIQEISPVLSQQVPALIAGVLPSLIDAGGQLLAGLITGLITALPQLAAQAPTIIQSVADAFTENGPAILAAGGQLLDMLADGISENLPSLLPMAADAILSFAAEITDPKNMDKVRDKAEDILDALGEGILNTIDVVADKAPEIIENLADSLVENAKSIWRGAEKLVDEIGDKISEKLPGLSGIFDNLESVVAGVTAALVAFKAAMAISSLIQSVTTAISAFRAANEAATIAQAALNAIMNANPFVLIATLIAGVTAALVTLYQTNEDFRNAVNSAWATVKETISNAVSNIKEFFTVKIPNAVDDAITALKNIPENMRKIGSDLLTGLWNGINDKVKWLKDQVSGVVDKIKSWFTGKNGFDTHSPSKWAEDVGSNVDKGLANGLNKSANAAVSAVGTMTRDMKNEIKKNLQNGLWDQTVPEWHAEDLEYYATEQSKVSAGVVSNLRNEEAAWKAVGDAREQAYRSSLKGQLSVGEKSLTNYSAGVGYMGNVIEDYDDEAYVLERMETLEKFAAARQALDQEFMTSAMEEEEYYDKLEELNNQLLGIDWWTRDKWTEIAEEIAEGRGVKIELPPPGQILSYEEFKEATGIDLTGGASEKTEAQKAAEDAEKARFEAIKKVMDQEAKYRHTSLQEQYTGWKFIQDRMEKDSYGYLESEKEVERLKEAIYDQYYEKVQATMENIISLEDNYQKQLTSRTQEIQKTYGLFGRVPEREVVSADYITRTLRGQIATMEEFYSNLDVLAARGAPEELVSQLNALGVDAVDEVAALTSMTDKELETYVELFQKKSKLAVEQATKELEPLREETDAKIMEQLQSATDLYNQNVATVGEAFTEGLAESIRLGMNDVVEAAQEVIRRSMEAAGVEAYLPTRSDVLGNYQTDIRKRLQNAGIEEQLRAAVDGATKSVSAALDVTTNSKVAQSVQNSSRWTTGNGSNTYSGNSSFTFNVDGHQFYSGTLDSLRDVEAANPVVKDDS